MTVLSDVGVTCFSIAIWDSRLKHRGSAADAIAHYPQRLMHTLLGCYSFLMNRVSHRLTFLRLILSACIETFARLSGLSAAPWAIDYERYFFWSSQVEVYGPPKPVFKIGVDDYLLRHFGLRLHSYYHAVSRPERSEVLGREIQTQRSLCR